MVNFARIYINDFMKDNLKSFNLKENSIVISLFGKRINKQSPNLNELKAFLDENYLLSSQLEADLFTAILGFYAFNINFNLYFCSEKDESVKLLSVPVISGIGTVSIFYNFHSFYITYNDREEIPNSLSIVESNLSENCHKCNEKKLFYKIRGKALCNSCLDVFIKKKIESRCEQLSLENFYNLECKTLNNKRLYQTLRNQ